MSKPLVCQELCESVKVCSEKSGFAKESGKT